jgi:hypothetical protein
MTANSLKLLSALLCASVIAPASPAFADEVTPAATAAVSVAGAEPISDPADYEVDLVDDDLKWGFTFYTVWLSEEQLGDVLLFQGELENSQLYVAALSRRLASFNEYVDAEVEVQLGKHAGPVQRHWEANGLGTLRWKRFPWSNHFGTTAGVGLGLSYAFDDPTFEVEANDTTNKWLVYILVELSFFLPDYPQWSAVARVHHRSAAYGTFEDDLEGASNAFGFGLKYRF